MTLNNLRIGPRLSIGFGAVLALLLVIVAIACWQLGRIADGLTELSNLHQRAGIAREWAGKTQLNVARAIAIAKASGQPAIEGFFAPQIKRTSAEIGELQKAMERDIVSAEGKALMAAVASQRQAYVTVREALFALVKQADMPAADSLLTGKVLPASEVYLDAMRAVQRHEADLASAEAENLQRGIGNARDALLALLAAAIVVGSAMAWLIARSITLPLRQGLDAAAVIAGGDLSQPVDSTHRDMAGSVAEYCIDSFEETVLRFLPVCNPCLLERSPPRDRRCQRGRSWNQFGLLFKARCSARGFSRMVPTFPDASKPTLDSFPVAEYLFSGFRVVLSPLDDLFPDGSVEILKKEAVAIRDERLEALRKKRAGETPGKGDGSGGP